MYKWIEKVLPYRINRRHCIIILHKWFNNDLYIIWLKTVLGSTYIVTNSPLVHNLKEISKSKVEWYSKVFTVSHSIKKNKIVDFSERMKKYREHSLLSMLIYIIKCIENMIQLRILCVTKFILAHYIRFYTIIQYPQYICICSQSYAYTYEYVIFM